MIKHLLILITTNREDVKIYSIFKDFQSGFQLATKCIPTQRQHCVLSLLLLLKSFHRSHHQHHHEPLQRNKQGAREEEEDAKVVLVVFSELLTSLDLASQHTSPIH